MELSHFCASAAVMTSAPLRACFIVGSDGRNGDDGGNVDGDNGNHSGGGGGFIL